MTVKPLVNGGGNNVAFTSKFANEGEEDEGEEPKAPSKRGKLRESLLALGTIVACLLALLFAAALCGACIVGSFFLWFRGVWNVWEWVRWRRSEEGKFVSGETEQECPTAMPGQEHGQNWRHAWQHVAKARNFRIRHEHGSEHFHVAPFLQSTTGLDMKRLCSLAKKKYNDRLQEEPGHAPRDEGSSMGLEGLDDLGLDPAGGSVSRAQVSAFGVTTVGCLRLLKTIRASSWNGYEPLETLQKTPNNDGASVD